MRQRRILVFFNTCFDKGHVKELVSWFLKKYGEKQTINFLETLKHIGFHQATKAGISLGIEDLQIPPEKPVLITEAQIATHKIEQQSAAGSLTSVEKSQCLIDTWNQTSDYLRQTAIQNFRNTNIVNPVYMMAFSGARGNISQVRQLVAMRGLMADPQGAILEFPIQSNFREGLTLTEYLNFLLWCSKRFSRYCFTNSNFWLFNTTFSRCCSTCCYFILIVEQTEVFYYKVKI